MFPAMLPTSADRAFRRYRATGDPQALGRVFDATVSELAPLARHLACSEASPQDLLQSTFLTAIESRQRFDERQRVLPWLLGILANHAREARRRSRREPDPGRMRREVGFDPAEEASLRDLEARLEQAIALLPEAHRPVLRLHLLHGLEPAEIAKSLERPPGTVRAQLSRGLDRLRRGLPRGLVAAPAAWILSAADFSALRGEVLARARELAPAAPLAATTTAWIALAMKQKLMLVSLLLLLLCLPIAWRAGRGAAVPVPGAPEAPGEPTRRDPVHGLDAQAPDASDSRRSAGAPPEAPAAPASTGKSQELAVLSVTVRDSEGDPLPGVGVAVRTTLEMQNLGTMLSFSPTDAAGVATVADLHPDDYCIEIDRAGRAGVLHLAAGEHRQHEIRLRGVDVRGRVIDERGAPVSEATIWAHANRLEALPVARCDAQGNFRLEDASPSVALQARVPGHGASPARVIQGKPGGTELLELTISRAAGEVSGRVLDVEGRPVPDALVAFVPESAKEVTPYDRSGPEPRSVQVRTDGDGQFHCNEVPQGSVIVSAAGAHPESTPASRLIEVTTTPLRVELRLGLGAVLEGRITDGPEPVPGCTVFLFCSAPEMPASYLFNLLAARVATSDDQGRFRIGGILAGTVDVRVLRGGMESIAQRSFEVAEGQALRWDVDCGSAVRLPFDLTLEPWPNDVGGQWLVNAMGVSDPGQPPAGPVAVQVVDSSGKVHFDSLPDGKVQIVIYRQPTPGDLIAVLSREVDARERQVTLRVPLERLRLRSVRGRLVDSRGAPLAAQSLCLRSWDQELPFSLQRRSAEDGRFEFEGLAPGVYALDCMSDGLPQFLLQFDLQGAHSGDLGELTPRGGLR